MTISAFTLHTLHFTLPSSACRDGRPRGPALIHRRPAGRHIRQHSGECSGHCLGELGKIIVADCGDACLLFQLLGSGQLSVPESLLCSSMGYPDRVE